ncbi:Quinic acid utilization activator [Fusarium oxysporum f. sp. albedinis]|nr:Quinic acid utilization activator [Fusarium oxysporum f. sp. albedinis]
MLFISRILRSCTQSITKVGNPKTTADINADSLVRTTFVRNAVNAAGINIAATALFNIKTFFDGEFENYFAKLGISGPHGGTVSVRLAINSIPSISSPRGVALTAYSAFGQWRRPIHGHLGAQIK